MVWNQAFGYRSVLCFVVQTVHSIKFAVDPSDPIPPAPKPRSLPNPASSLRIYNPLHGALASTISLNLSEVFPPSYTMPRTLGDGSNLAATAATKTRGV